MENIVTKKAGCVLVNIEKQKVILVFRNKDGECTFPKGHLKEFWIKSKHRVKKIIEEYNQNGRKI